MAVRGWICLLALTAVLRVHVESTGSDPCAGTCPKVGCECTDPGTSTCNSSSCMMEPDDLICTQCMQGWWNSNTVTCTTCTQCTDGKTTNPTALATSAEDCVCPPGFEFTVGAPGNCDTLCSGGNYRSTFGLACDGVCGTNRDTSADGQSCTNCPAGQEKDGMTDPGPEGCKLCDTGTYRVDDDNDDDLCDDCDEGYTTAGMGAQSAAECTVCAAGWKDNGAGACVKCSAGTYKPGPGNTGCQDCPGELGHAPGTEGRRVMRTVHVLQEHNKQRTFAPPARITRLIQYGVVPAVPVRTLSSPQTTEHFVSVRKDIREMQLIATSVREGTSVRRRILPFAPPVLASSLPTQQTQQLHLQTVSIANLVLLV